MTNYTNHNYNSNNDNISITIILWIHFNPFRCTGSFGWPWVVHAWGTLVAQGVIDRRDKIWPTKINKSPLGLDHGGGLGIILELEGASEGGSGSVERDRQNRELYSNRILQMDQNNTTDKSFPHSV